METTNSELKQLKINSENLQEALEDWHRLSGEFIPFIKQLQNYNRQRLETIRWIREKKLELEKLQYHYMISILEEIDNRLHGLTKE